MSDLGETFRGYRDEMRELKRLHGIDCPGCKRVQPKRTPTVMLPGKKCRVCGFVDQRPLLKTEGEA